MDAADVIVGRFHTRRWSWLVAGIMVLGVFDDATLMDSQSFHAFQRGTLSLSFHINGVVTRVRLTTDRTTLSDHSRVEWNVELCG